MKKIKLQQPLATPWLVTFADVVMLLMVFFVLLLSMSSFERTAISRIRLPQRDSFHRTDANAERRKANSKKIATLLLDKKNIPSNNRYILELIFAKAVLPIGLDKDILFENIKFENKQKGACVTIKNSLLFNANRLSLSSTGEKLLDLLTPVILTVGTDISIRAGGSVAPAGNAKKAMEILSYFHSKGIAQNAMSFEVLGDKGQPQVEIVFDE